MRLRHLGFALMALGAVVLLFAVRATAAAPRTMATQVEGQDLLERVYDHARCLGVPRLGFRRWHGTREFAVLDCRTDDGFGLLCDKRWKVVPPGTVRDITDTNRHGQRFQMRVVLRSGCVRR